MNDNDPRTSQLLQKKQSLGKLLQRAAKAHSSQMLAMLAERGHDGLSFFHTALITNLDAEGTRITVLADRAGMSKQSMSELVSELEKRSYVERVRDPTDQRAFLIRFTDSGKQLLTDAREAKESVEAGYASVIGEDGIEHLTRLLEVLVVARSI
jgi:DNA-binding MarR family transcriptional regulator